MFKADRLKKLRKEAGLIQADVSTQLNIRRETYTKYEIGQITPPSDMIIALAKIFDTTSDYLLGITDDPKSPDKKEKAPPAETERSKNLKYLSELIEKLDINDLAKVEDYMDLLIGRHKK